MSRPVRFLAAIVVAALSIAGCMGPGTSDGDDGPATGVQFSGRVGITATGFTLDGNDWWPVGYNAYQLGTDWSVNVGCGARVDLDDYFGSLPPRALTRFNLYSALAVDKITGMSSFAPFDNVFAAARRHDQMVLPVLTGSSGDCENEQFKPRNWYETGWRNEPAAGGMTYQQWVTAAVTRWRDEPTLAGWELVGEPEASTCGPDGCAWVDRSCPPGGADVLRDFFDAAGPLVRELDDAHPIFSGFTGGDQCGLVGADLERVAGSDYLEVIDFHDYPDNGRDPAGSDLPARIQQARDLRKPIVVNEIGLEAGSCRTTEQRAEMFAERIEAARSAGVAGALLWAFVPDPRTGECTYDVGYNDPVRAVIADIAAG